MARNKGDPNWPAWYYGPAGEAKVFQSEAEVPQGWLDAPGKHYDPTPPIAPAPDTSLPLTRKQVLAGLSKRGVKFNPRLSTRELYDTFIAVIETDGQ